MGAGGLSTVGGQPSVVVIVGEGWDPAESLGGSQGGKTRPTPPRPSNPPRYCTYIYTKQPGAVAESDTAPSPRTKERNQSGW